MRSEAAQMAVKMALSHCDLGLHRCEGCRLGLGRRGAWGLARDFAHRRRSAAPRRTDGEHRDQWVIWADGKRVLLSKRKKMAVMVARCASKMLRDYCTSGAVGQVRAACRPMRPAVVERNERTSALRRLDSARIAASPLFALTHGVSGEDAWLVGRRLDRSD